MLTPEQAHDLQTVLHDYENALLYGDNDAVCRTAETLDVTVTAIRADAEEDPDNLALWPVIVQSYSDERDLAEAALWVKAAKLIVSTVS